MTNGNIIALIKGLTEDSGGGGGGSGASLEQSLSVTENVGGVKSGDTYASGTKLEKIFRDMLNPVKYPSFTNPSVTISIPGSKLLETGGSLAATLTATFSRGSISPAYGTSGYRSGPVQDYSLNGGISQSGNTFNIVVTGSNNSFQVEASYEAGEQPKDSIGEDYSTPLAAGSVSSNTIAYEFVDALWANTANIDTIAKLALVSKSTKQNKFVFPAQTVANPEVFDVPASWTVTAVEVLNTLSNQYEDCSSEFTITDTTHNDAAGNSVSYKRYTDNRGYNADGRTIRIKWN